MSTRHTTNTARAAGVRKRRGRTCTPRGLLAPTISLTDYGGCTHQLETMVTGVARHRPSGCRGQNEIPVLYDSRMAADFQACEVARRNSLRENANVGRQCLKVFQEILLCFVLVCFFFKPHTPELASSLQASRSTDGMRSQET